MSISQNFPEEGPTLNLNFAGSRTLDPRITFTRTSTGTYMGSDGLIKVASANSPRFDHRYVNGEIESLGLLVEESRQNLLTGSEDFGPSYWSALNSVSTSLNAVASPDGNSTADKFIENTNTTHKVLARTFTLTASTTYTYSLFVKAAERNAIMIHIRKSDYTDRFGASFNLSTQAVTNETSGVGVLDSADIKKYPNDWYRISITGNIGTNTSAVVPMYLIGSGGAFDIAYTGDGTSGIYVWGAQLEQGSFPTSYIPTQNSTVTRTADNASMTGSNFSSWFNQGDGTFLINGSAPYQFQRSFGVSAFNTATVNDNRLSIRMGNTFMRTNAVEQFGFYQQQSTNSYKVAVAYGTNTASQVLNAVIAGTDTSVITPSNYDVMEIGKVESNTSLYTNGTISQLIYYPTRLPNSQLQTLTR